MFKFLHTFTIAPAYAHYHSHFIELFGQSDLLERLVEIAVEGLNMDEGHDPGFAKMHLSVLISGSYFDNF